MTFLFMILSQYKGKFPLFTAHWGMVQDILGEAA